MLIDSNHGIYRAVYAGAKAFIVAFTEALAGELAESGVHVQACLPGLVNTEYHALVGRDPSKMPPMMQPADAASTAMVRMSRVATVLSMVRANRTRRPGRLGTFSSGLKSTGGCLVGSAVICWRGPEPGDCKGKLLLEQHNQQREDHDVEAQFCDGRTAEGAIEADEVQEGTQHGEDCNGGARVDHERRDEHAADRQFREAVHHGLVDQLGRRPKALMSIRNAAQFRSAVATRAAAWLS